MPDNIIRARKIQGHLVILVHTGDGLCDVWEFRVVADRTPEIRLLRSDISTRIAEVADWDYFNDTIR